MARPKTQGSNTRNEQVTSKAQLARIRSGVGEVEVVLEKIIVLKQGQEVEVDKTPDIG
jgi:hypothetical protein